MKAMFCVLMSFVIAGAFVMSSCGLSGGNPDAVTPGGGSSDNNDDNNPEPDLPDDPGEIERKDYVKYVDTLAGDLAKGATIAGPCMPNGSIHPSPETRNPENGGYRTGEQIVGFGQLYSQGTGGHQSYGNFLLSPQCGNIAVSEADHASLTSMEKGTANYYCVNLDRYGIFAEITPADNAALYSFTYKTDDGAAVLDVSRKTGGSVAMKEGFVKIDAAKRIVTGGGIFTSNWNPADWEMYVAVRFDREFAGYGLWSDGILHEARTEERAYGNRLGAYFRFDTSENKTVRAEVAVSFKSAEAALAFLDAQTGGKDFETLKKDCGDKWNEILGAVDLTGNITEIQKKKFYSAMYFANVHPRNRMSDSGFWDDYYTVWDSWKSVFPFMALTRPEAVASNVNSFINRYEKNGIMTDAFIQGKEFVCGQGGNDIENIIADAYLYGITGVDWEKTYEAMKNNAEKLRSPFYLANGYQGSDSEKKAACGMNYSYRLYPSSATAGFAFNDYAVSVLAKQYGTAEEYEKYAKRAENWKNIWNASLSADGFTGFAQNKTESGEFVKVSHPDTGYNSHYYEANIWEGSFYPVYDVPSLMQLMGGRREFTKRLEYACAGGKIKFDNEPAFQTVWLLSNENVRRPDLAAKYADEFLSYFPAGGGYHDDEDGGAMSTMYMFLQSGFFPMSCTGMYYLHGTRLPGVTFNLQNGKKFEIKGVNVSDENIYVQSATFNGKVLDDCFLTYDQVKGGGTLEFVMGREPSNWAKFPEDTVVPPAVTEVCVSQAHAAQGIAYLTWKAGPAEIGSYRIYSSSEAGFEISSENFVAEVTGAAYTGLPGNGVHYYKIAAVGLNGNVSGASEAVCVQIERNFGSAYTGDADENLAFGKKTDASGVSAPAGTDNYELPSYAVDGLLSTKWSCRSSETNPGDGTGNYWLEIDLGKICVISRWTVYHAQAGGERASYNTRDFRLQAKIEGEWIDADAVENNTNKKTDRNVNSFAAQFVRLYITLPVQNGNSVSARIYEFGLYSQPKNDAENLNFNENFDSDTPPAGFDVAVTGAGKIDFTESGIVTLSTPSSGEATIKKVFDDQFEGKICFEVRFKNMSSSHKEFANLLFLKNSANSAAIVTIAVETGRLRYNVGGWKTVSFGGEDLFLRNGEWYVLKISADFDSQKIGLYLTGTDCGKGNPGNVQPLGENVYLGEYDFRSKTSGNPDTVEMAIGSGKDYTCFSVDYLKIYR